MRPLCKVCSKEVNFAQSLYCSRVCRYEQEYQSWIAKWLAGEKSGLRGGVAVSQHIRKYLKRTQGECCAICGWAEVNPHTGSIPLHLDHKDGNWENNRPNNVWLICPNDHALTSTYGSLNKGHGRPYHVIKKQQ
jgi:hypothetical protein